MFALLKRTVMNLKDSIFNVNKLHSRLTDVPSTRLHLFANGLYSQLDKKQIKQLKDIITSDYKNVMSTLNNISNSTKN